MASAVAADSPLITFLQRARPSALTAPRGSEYSANELVKSTYPAVEYNDAEKAEINQWLITSAHVAAPEEDKAKTAERLSSLNTHLSTRTTLLGAKPSLADIAMYARLAPVVSKWTDEERTGKQGYHHVVRHLDFVQKAQLFGLTLSESDRFEVDVDKVLAPIKPIDPKAEKERKKKEKEAAAAEAGDNGAGVTLPERVKDGGQKTKKEAKGTGEVIAAAVGLATPGVTQPSAGNKKEKKEKQPKPQKQVAPEKPLSPALIDLRVGHILKAENHPNADSLYVSTIACGDAPGTDNTSEYEGQIVRTVCSGLNGLIPLAEMQGRKIVAVCNLKPVTMRGIKSSAMVLAASPRVVEGEDNHKGPVELVNVPEAAKAGDRIFFEGWEGEPEAVLNPKKKIWENCQVGFTTTDSCEVGFDAGAVEQLEGKTGLGKLQTKTGMCTVLSLKGATVR